MKKTVAIDFDGVIHSYTTPFNGDHSYIPDPPVPGSKEAMWRYVEKYNVVVFSVRAAFAAEAIRQWMKVWEFPEVEITAIKPSAHVYVDDRGWRFDGNWDFDMDALVDAPTWYRDKDEL